MLCLNYFLTRSSLTYVVPPPSVYSESSHSTHRPKTAVHHPLFQELDSVGRLMVNLTDPNTHPPGGRTWAIAFVGTAGDLPMLTADGEGLLPDPSRVSRTLDADGNYTDEDTIAYWPVDSAAISVWEAQRCVLFVQETTWPKKLRCKKQIALFSPGHHKGVAEHAPNITPIPFYSRPKINFSRFKIRWLM